MQRDHVSLSISCIDRLCLKGSMPRLQRLISVAGHIWLVYESQANVEMVARRHVGSKICQSGSESLRRGLHGADVVQLKSPFWAT